MFVVQKFRTIQIGKFQDVPVQRFSTIAYANISLGMGIRLKLCKSAKTTKEVPMIRQVRESNQQKPNVLY